jgi:hypothetical protein
VAGELLGFQSGLPAAVCSFLLGRTESSEPKFGESPNFYRFYPPERWFTIGWGPLITAVLSSIDFPTVVQNSVYCWLLPLSHALGNMPHLGHLPSWVYKLGDPLE